LDGDGGEVLHARAELRVHRVRLRRLHRLRRYLAESSLVKDDDAARIDDARWRLEEEAVDDAEHRRVHADAEGKRQGHHRGEAGAEAKGADGVAEVVRQSVQHGSSDWTQIGHAREAPG